jgi:hypothetical protein
MPVTTMTVIMLKELPPKTLTNSVLKLPASLQFLIRRICKRGLNAKCNTGHKIAINSMQKQDNKLSYHQYYHFQWLQCLFVLGRL